MNMTSCKSHPGVLLVPLLFSLCHMNVPNTGAPSVWVPECEEMEQSSAESQQLPTQSCQNVNRCAFIFYCFITGYHKLIISPLLQVTCLGLALLDILLRVSLGCSRCQLPFSFRVQVLSLLVIGRTDFLKVVGLRSHFLAGCRQGLLSVLGLFTGLFRWLRPSTSQQWQIESPSWQISDQWLEKALCV